MLKIVMAPFNKVVLVDRPDRDSYNFHVSQLRIRIEMAFGLLVNKWRILKQPLFVRLRHCRIVISACMRLHNFCITQRCMTANTSPQQMLQSMARYVRSWNNQEPLHYDASDVDVNCFEEDQIESHVDPLEVELDDGSRRSLALTSCADESLEWTYVALLRRAFALRDELLTTSNLALNSLELVGRLDHLAGGIAVPLHPAYPADEMDYIVSDSGDALLVVNESFTAPDSKLKEYVAGLPMKMNVEVIVRPDDVKGGDEKELSVDQQNEMQQWLETRDYCKAGAYKIYTSAPRECNGHLIHFLPLHHVHEILNDLLCVMYVGGSVELLPFVKPLLIWAKLGEASYTKRPVTMLMAVPTVYMKLQEDLEKQPQDDSKVQSVLAGACGLRLAISGSMACQFGMVLTNPLQGDSHLGYVGNIFPSVSVRVVDPDTKTELSLSEEKADELRVKGPSVFREYWRKPEATSNEFDANGTRRHGEESFRGLFQRLDDAYQQLDHVFMKWLSQLDFSSGDVHLQERKEKSFEFACFNVLPFDTHFKGVEKHFVNVSLYEKAEKGLNVPDTIIADFKKETFSSSFRVDIQVKQVIRRYVEEDRDVVIWVAHAGSIEFKHKLLQGLIHHLLGYAVTRRSSESTPDRVVSVLQLCYKVSLTSPPTAVHNRLPRYYFHSLEHPSAPGANRERSDRPIPSPQYARPLPYNSCPFERDDGVMNWEDSSDINSLSELYNNTELSSILYFFGRDKLTNVESQRMMAVMGDLLDRLNYLTYVPLEPQGSLLESLRESRCLNSAELLREHWRWEQLYVQATQAMDSHQVRATARAMCRDLRENPVAVEVLYHKGTTAHDRSEDLQMLVKALSELTDLTHAQLDKTLEDAKSKKELMAVAESRMKQAEDERLAIREKLTEMRKTKEEEVALLDAQVQKLRNELHTINQTASHELMMIDTDLKDAQAKAHDQHADEMKLLLDQASALELNATKMAQEHQEEEDVLRKKKCKMAAEVAAVVEKFDGEMEAMEGELRTLEETFRKEREQCEQFNEHFLKIDEEQSRIDAEERVLDEIRTREREKQMMIYNAATRIQKVYRGLLCRRDKKSFIEPLAHPTDVLAVAFRPDGKQLASTTLNGAVNIWDVEDGEQVGTIDGKRDIAGGRKEGDHITAANNQLSKHFTSVCYSADGALLLAGGRSKFVCIYAVEPQILLKKFQISHNLSLDGILEKLNSKNVTESGLSKNELDAHLDDSEASGRSAGDSLVGAKRAVDPGSRRKNMEVLSKAVLFSPTGRAWAAATTEGLLIYGLDESLAFDPFELDEDITPETITRTLARREYARALVMALHLNEEPLIARCVEGIPIASIPLVAQTLRGEMYLQRLLQLLAKRMERSPHLEFYLQWSLAVLNTHGQTLRDDPSSSTTCLPTLRSLQKSIARHLQDLAKMYSPSVRGSCGDLETRHSDIYRIMESCPMTWTHIKKKRATLSDWTMMMRHISNGIKATLGAPTPNPQDEAHAIVLFKIGYEKLTLKPSQRTRRAERIKLTTVLRLQQCCSVHCPGSLEAVIITITGVSTATFYRIVYRVMFAINDSDKLAPRFPSTPQGLSSSAAAFRSCSSHGIIENCIGGFAQYVFPEKMSVDEYYLSFLDTIRSMDSMFKPARITSHDLRRFRLAYLEE
ncbi:Periodic tryptophan protein 2 [Phytophthora citrophthora]|uniref:Periodic tryptophan protein 2 n=1 Tax=Phytophthora citrophthora TaxID=4793 RepID=A0AAD9LF79_9STRA|nr:Periodic tryptophan protein 2 [Phytophthora citrophthora]